jgi:predicted ATPase
VIESVRFTNFKVLRDAELKLGPFNILVGPNGSGKSTVFKALQSIKKPEGIPVGLLRTVGVSTDSTVTIDSLWLAGQNQKIPFTITWDAQTAHVTSSRKPVPHTQSAPFFDSTQIFALEPSKTAATVQLQPKTVLGMDGANLAGALDNLRDISEESFESLKQELRQWLPEFDSILFDTPSPGQRSFKLRQAVSKEAIRSTDLSEWTIIALALLYIAHNPSSPKVICLEEPDRGLHPRLLRDLRDALYRLSYPTQFGIRRESVQVIATTHSPYFLDLFKDHPEEIIIAEKQPDATAKFKSLADDKQLIEIIGDAPLGEVWYSGILGGVPIRK